MHVFLRVALLEQDSWNRAYGLHNGAAKINAAGWVIWQQP